MLDSFTITKERSAITVTRTSDGHVEKFTTRALKGDLSPDTKGAAEGPRQLRQAPLRQQDEVLYPRGRVMIAAVTMSDVLQGVVGLLVLFAFCWLVVSLLERLGIPDPSGYMGGSVIVIAFVALMFLYLALFG